MLRITGRSRKLRTIGEGNGEKASFGVKRLYCSPNMRSRDFGYNILTAGDHPLVQIFSNCLSYVSQVPYEEFSVYAC